MDATSHSLFPDSELYVLLLGFLADSPCQEAFQALRREVEQHGLLGRLATTALHLPRRQPLSSPRPPQARDRRW